MANFKHFTIVAIVAVCTAAFVLNISDEPKKPEPAPLANTKTNEPVQRDKIPQDSVTKPIRYVSDYENIYIRKEEKILTDLIARFEKNTQVQIALITIDSSMTTKDNLDAFTLKIANEWGIGQKNKNNGITIGISKYYRKMRICNGYGIQEILTDEETQEIIDNGFIPQFKNDNYFEGTSTGLKALMDILIKKLKK